MWRAEIAHGTRRRADIQRIARAHHHDAQILKLSGFIQSTAIVCEPAHPGTFAPSLGRQKLTESIKNNICTGDTQRRLVPGTLKIYPMKGYGVVEMTVP